MWYRLTNNKDHDYIIRQIKPFVNSKLGQVLGLDYKKLMSAPYRSHYLKSWERWRTRSARMWNGWIFYEITPGDFQFFGLKVGHVIDLNKLRNSTLKQFSTTINNVREEAKKVKTKRKENKIKNLLGNSWSNCFKL